MLRQKAKLILSKVANCVRVHIIWAEFDACLNATKHNWMRRLEYVASIQHIVPSFFVQ